MMRQKPVAEYRWTIAVAGGFDPLHAGHVSHIWDAYIHCGPAVAANKLLLERWLVVILARDRALKKKKGWSMLSWDDRAQIMRALRWVDDVVEGDEDGTCVQALEKLRPQVFAKGGDRTEDNMPAGELEVCKRLGIQIVYGVGGEKVTSSQQLVAQVISQRGGR